jgi:hypothetical protein
MDANGSNQTQLTSDPYLHDQVPDWSPDGSKIAFASGGFGEGQIWVMNANGSDQRQLTGCGPADPSPCAVGDDSAPRGHLTGRRSRSCGRFRPWNQQPTDLRHERRLKRSTPVIREPDSPRFLLAGTGVEAAAGLTDMSTADVRCMRGDHDAFAALVGAASDRLYALACLILRDRSGRGRHAGGARPGVARGPEVADPDRFDAWLRRLVVNACYDEARLPAGAPKSRSSCWIIPSTTPRRRRPRRIASIVPSGGCHSTSVAGPPALLRPEPRRDRRPRIPLGTVKSRVRYGVAAMRAQFDGRSPAVARLGTRMSNQIDRDAAATSRGGCMPSRLTSPGRLLEDTFGRTMTTDSAARAVGPDHGRPAR